MLGALGRLVDRRRRGVLIASVAVVFAAGAYGGPVAGLLETGDDFSDPRSESIQARDTIERTTGRSSAPDAIVLVRLGAEAGTPEADRRLEEVRSRIADDDVASDRRARAGAPVAAGLGGPPLGLPARDLLHGGRRGRGRRRAGGAPARRARRDRGRRGRGLQPGRRPGGGRPAARRAAGRADPAALLAAGVPQPRRRPAAARRRHRDRAAHVLRPAARQRVRADVDVRDQPHDRARARPRDRLLAVHGLPLPRGARRRRGPLAGDPRDRAHRGPDGPVLRLHRGRRAGGDARLPPALPVLDGRRRRARGAQRRARLPDAAPSAARRARAARERDRAAPLEGGDAARRRPRAGGSVVPLLARGDAAAGTRRRVRRDAADRDGAAVPAGRVHRRRRVRAAAGEVGARRRRRDPRGVPARSDVAGARGRGCGRARAPCGGGLRAAARRRSTAWRA